MSAGVCPDIVTNGKGGCNRAKACYALPRDKNSPLRIWPLIESNAHTSVRAIAVLSFGVDNRPSGGARLRAKWC